jgi:hypothetical protein
MLTKSKNVDLGHCLCPAIIHRGDGGINPIAEPTDEIRRQRKCDAHDERTLKTVCKVTVRVNARQKLIELISKSVAIHKLYSKKVNNPVAYLLCVDDLHCA